MEIINKKQFDFILYLVEKDYNLHFQFFLSMKKVKNFYFFLKNKLLLRVRKYHELYSILTTKIPVYYFLIRKILLVVILINQIVYLYFWFLTN